MASITQSQGVAPHLLSPIGNQVAVEEPQESLQNHKPRDIVTTFNYFKDPEDGSEPEPSYVDKPLSYERPNISQQLVVHDIRGTEDEYTLDTTGFQVVKHESVEKDFVDDEHIKAVYYPETEELLKKATGASKIFIFDHTIRRAAQDSRGKIPEPSPIPNPADGPIIVPVPQQLRGPVQRVHIDQSYDAAPSRVTYHLPDEADTLLAGRFQIINVWRPIRTIRRDPLGIASAHSVLDSELVPIKLIYPRRVGETLSVRPAGKERKDGGHQWYYLFEQSPSEVTLIKCFDSKTDGRARRVPHSAFVDEEFKDADSRESIEVRALVFHPDDTY